jgi:hypothetical protein
MAFLRMIPLAGSLLVWTRSSFTHVFSRGCSDQHGPPAKPLAIDGKTARRSHDRGVGKAAIQTVSAWTSETHLAILGRHPMASMRVSDRCCADANIYLLRTGWKCASPGSDRTVSSFDCA